MENLSNVRRAAPNPRAARATKKSATRDFLISVGEELFGRHGIDGISLREIAKKAGQANNAAVHYYFKDKNGIVKAILDDRVARVEALRRARLEAMRESERADLRELLKILWLPSMTITGADGGHTFCRFLLQYMLHPGMVRHPVAEFSQAAGKRNSQSDKAVASTIVALDLAQAQLRHVSPDVFHRRLSMLSMMFLAAVVEFDNARRVRKRGSTAGFAADPILDMAIAALAAPG